MKEASNAHCLAANHKNKKNKKKQKKYKQKKLYNDSMIT
jgi:hypothetical protein